MNHLWNHHSHKNRVKINARHCLISQGSFWSFGTKQTAAMAPASAAWFSEKALCNFARVIQSWIWIIDKVLQLSHTSLTWPFILHPAQPVQPPFPSASEMVKMFLPTQKIPEGSNREELQEEGISGGAAELNTYWEIRVGLGYKTITICIAIETKEISLKSSIYKIVYSYIVILFSAISPGPRSVLSEAQHTWRITLPLTWR